MKNVRKDNKGFSLVELIVVVLIMAIIAVALAPQVMKWVNNSRITADQNACGNIKTAVQAAVADYQAKGGKLGGSGATLVTAKYKLTGTTFSDVTDWTTGSIKLQDSIEDALGQESYETKYDNTDKFEIEVTEKGAVTVKCKASVATID